ncbi:PLP-dependent aminotransferase family protein [Gluconacetobacter azotocaptans]|uniref:PLP-dependent aminotransferase family protein n=1 Tax=Gluconacetobacter azotocaptans TaxID=142834 RepID=A0A7W4JTW2_9PROT|nr:PLP-dependent aminotransferase family protein [Gluconacetobacter azotocaptans]MBB2190810.1 PLP-dependent aminotransferase family protein [Gluconacetobacter azotocaptans]MBM9400744.1 PLP-dependent aminotransferase family protein [Gluconacetobacter azotocaptans]GBQ30848.1 MocR family transcriptional regulator [Gluconacetobacter azotocaptans DSM 13594]
MDDDCEIKNLPADSPEAYGYWRRLIGPLHHAEEGTLKIMLHKQLVSAICSGRLAAGTALPSQRALARALSISRNTVIQAYLLLATEGLVDTRDRSRHRVSNIAHDVSQARTSAPCGQERPAHPVSWSERLIGSVSKQRPLQRDPRWRESRYAFIYGQCDQELFPLAQWREVQRDTLSATALRRWAGDPYDEDNAYLVKQICSTLLPRRGLWAVPEEILITSGIQNALAILSLLLLGPDYRCAFEDPGHPDLRAVLRLRSANIQNVLVDEEGLRVADLTPGISMLYCSPVMQFPTTAPMSASRRAQLYYYARQNDTIIVEDDVDSEAWFAGDAPYALKADDPDGRVIYLGTFSKALAPGLRLGFMVAPPHVIHEARLIRRLLMRSPPTNNQATLGEFIGRGYYSGLVCRARQTWEKRARILSDSVARHMPDTVLAPIHGGSAGWLTLPDGVRSDQFCRSLAAHSIYADDGGMFYRHRDVPQALRLGFTSMSTGIIEDGIERMGHILQTAARDV